VISLARQVRELDPGAARPGRLDPSRLPPESDDEVRELADALARYSQRLAEFVDRERNFTRDASHELRSPLTVIDLAAEMQLADPTLGESARRSARRILRAARDMEELTEAFLLLARENETGLPLEEVCVNEVVAEELERATALAEGRPVEARLCSEQRSYLLAPEKVLSILLGNLLRNAFAYTDAGTVSVTVHGAGVTIEDTGVGIAPEHLAEMYRPFVRGEGSRQGGHGVGLSIVRRLSDRFAWPVSIDSVPGRGTRVEVRFPGARSEPALT
jgi:signal transduction histidine kinase